jgi:hypothetical protein
MSCTRGGAITLDNNDCYSGTFRTSAFQLTRTAREAKPTCLSQSPEMPKNNLSKDWSR